MVDSSVNLFDLGVLLIIGLSALLSFFRGFVREVLSLGAWMGATVVTLYLFPSVSEWITPQVKSPVIGSGLSSIGLFFVALIVISIFTGLILKFVKSGSEVGLVDNLVGLAFGVARGVLVVGILYFIATIVVVEEDFPPWVKEARSRPYVARTARYLGALAPDYLNNLLAQSKSGDDAAHPHAQDPSQHEKKPSASMIPSIEDLQLRIHEENRRHEP